MFKPLVSILIPTYNGEKYIEKCIDSCLNQSYSNIEICITDDGSEDNTWKILKEKYDSNNKIILSKLNKNKGITYALNNCFELSTGEYIAFMGHDDICFSDRIRVSLKNINGYNLIFGNLVRFKKDRIISDNYMRDNLGIENTQEISFEYLLENPIVYGNTMFAKREILNDVFPLDERLTHEDWWIPLVISRKSNILYLDKKMVKYREHSKEVSGNGNYSNMKYNEWLEKNYKEIYYYKKILLSFDLKKNQQNLVKGKLYYELIFKNHSNLFKRLKYYCKYFYYTNDRFYRKIKFIINVFNPKFHYILFKFKSSLKNK
jgi:glycosyltransferase involved in cell wall biosynthesis